jgi:PhnB protein
MAVKPVPQGYHTATPYLICKGAAAAIDFYTKAFGATERMRFAAPDGQIGHAEVQIGDSTIMMADEAPQMDAKSPQTIGGTPVFIMLYVENVDETFRKALAAGGKEVHPLANKFYGDRSGTLVDPFGHLWTVATHVEDVTPEEMQRRAQEAMKQQVS